MSGLTVKDLEKLQAQHPDYQMATPNSQSPIPHLP